MKNKKFAISIEKAYEENSEYFIQGVASGTLEDMEEERMSKDVLKNFVNTINTAALNGRPMPITNGHAKGGPVGADLGEIMFAELKDDEANSMFVKARLDPSNPMVPYLMKKVNDGKHFAFSVEGTKPEIKKTWSEKLGKVINEYVSVVPKCISITSQPSYSPSFFEFVQKSYEFYTDEEKNNLIKSNVSMEEETKVMEATAETPVMEEAIAEPAKVEEIVETKTEEVAEAVAEVAQESVIKSSDMEVTELAEEIAEAVEGDKTDEVIESLEEAVEEAKESLDEIEKDEEMAELESKIDGLCEMVEKMTEVLASLVASDAKVHASIGETEKSIGEFETVLKSVHEDVEVLKDQPLAKKSLVAKSYDEAKTPEETNPYRKFVTRVMGDN